MYRIRIVISLGLLFCIPAIQAQTLNFNLTGTITPGVCQFTVADVDLGTYSAALFTGSYSTTAVDVPVTIQRCDPLVTAVRMDVSGEADAADSNLFKGVAGIGIDLRSALNGVIRPAGTRVNYNPNTGGGTYTFKAKFKQSAATVAAGTVKAPITITVTYN
ncbi:fimbrial protein [Pinirhizobacter soli]|uniref:fimbrial protein n=1 Tax=Pinirhizobacter soli TaxID=2786953 RepID=UPI00202A76F9|nr:fimbrial protein [Pinirhizobacter soli]